MGLGLLANTAVSGAAGLWAGVLGVAAGAALLVVPFAMGGMGAGDVKMLAAVGAIAGPQVAFNSFLYGAIAGGLVAAVLLAGRCYLFRGRTTPAAGAKAKVRETFPYGVAIFAGTVFAYVLR
jgi:prepilin peptidase CpaA